MSYFEETMDNIRTYLKLNRDDWQEKAGKSSSRGFVYTVPAGDGLPPMRVNVRVDERLEYLIFEAYPGVRAVEPEYRYALALFCQTHTPEVGSLQLEEEYGEVYFHCETPFENYACGGGTMRALESAARDGIAPVLPLLRALAKGYPVPEAESDWSMQNMARGDFDAENVAAIGSYLQEDSGHNIIGLGDTDARVPFTSEILVRTSRYTLEVHRQGAFLTLWLFCGTAGICVEPAYQMRAAWFLNKLSDEKKVGFYSMGNRCGVKVNLCTAEGAVSGKSMEEQEALMVHLLKETDRDMLRLACGRATQEEQAHLRAFDRSWRLDDPAKDSDDAQCFDGLFRLPGLLDPDEDEVELANLIDAAVDAQSDELYAPIEDEIDLPDLPEEPEDDEDSADDENPDDAAAADEADDEDRPVA